MEVLERTISFLQCQQCSALSALRRGIAARARLRCQYAAGVSHCAPWWARVDFVVGFLKVGICQLPGWCSGDTSLLDEWRDEDTFEGRGQKRPM